MNKYTIIIIIVIILILVIYRILHNRMIYGCLKSGPILYSDWLSQIKWLVCEPKYFNKYVITTQDNVEINVYYVHNPSSKKYCMYIHDFGSNLPINYEQIDFLYNYSSVVFFDYRSDNAVSIMNQSINYFKYDCDAVWDWLTNKLLINSNDIAIVSHGISAILALYLNSRLSQSFDTSLYPYTIILLSPFFDTHSYMKHYTVGIYWIENIKNVISNFMPNMKIDEYVDKCNCSVPIIINCDTYTKLLDLFIEKLELYEIPYTLYKIEDLTDNKYIRLDKNFIYKMTEIFEC